MATFSDLQAWVFSPTTGANTDPSALLQRANSFASQLSGMGTAMLVLQRDESGLVPVVVLEGAAGSNAVIPLAHAVGAHAEPVDDLPDLWGSASSVGVLVFDAGAGVTREAQVGMDVTETSRLLSHMMPVGSWVAITLRRPTGRESRRWGRWLRHRLSTAVPTHHSLSPDAVVVSVFAGADDASAVKALLDSARSAMPSFDLAAVPVVPSAVGAAAPWWGLAVLGLAGGVGSHFTDVFDLVGLSLTGVGVLLGLFGVGRFRGWVPSRWRSLQRAVYSGVLPAPLPRRGWWRAPRAASVRGDREVAARDGDYPLASSAFLVGPQVVVGLVAPQAGAMSGAASTRDREVPAVMREQVGPMVGTSDGVPAHLSADDAFGGVAVVGKPGSGKSLLVRALFGWSCAERVSASGRPGFPGAHNAVIAFESKGDGVAEYKAWADSMGDEVLVIDMADPNTYKIDMLDIPGTASERAMFFVDAMKYAFGEEAVGDRSTETLLSLLPGAMLVSPQMALLAQVDPAASPLFYAHVLLGAHGDETGRALYAELAGAAARSDADAQLRTAVAGMAPLYGQGVSFSQRRNLQEAPRNKLRQLIELESWWSPSRPSVSWSQVLTNHGVVVINTGTSTSGEGRSSMVEETLSQLMSSMLMFSLRHAIQRVCSGWQAQGRSVSIFADELSLLAGSSEQVITWLKDQGRSFGVRPVLATQRPEQLPDRVRSAFMNFSTLVSFAQEDMATARQIAEAVSGAEGEWSASDVLQLDPYVAVVRGHVGKKRQQAFTVRVPNFEADRAGFVDVQGLSATTVVTQPAPVSEPVPVVAEPDESEAPDLMGWSADGGF